MHPACPGFIAYFTLWDSINELSTTVFVAQGSRQQRRAFTLCGPQRVATKLDNSGWDGNAYAAWKLRADLRHELYFKCVSPLSGLARYFPRGVYSFADNLSTFVLKP